MPARAAEGHPVAVGSDGRRRDRVELQTVDGEEGRDPVAQRAFGEQVADAAQVALALLPDIADEEEVLLGLDPGGVERADEGQQHREAAGVVADAGREELRAFAPDGAVRALGEDRVEMGRDDDHLAVGPAAADAGDVADGVAAHLLETELAEHRLIGQRAALLLEGRGGDLGQRDDLLDQAVMLAAERCDGRLELRRSDDLRDLEGHGVPFAGRSDGLVRTGQALTVWVPSAAASGSRSSNQIPAAATDMARPSWATPGTSVNRQLKPQPRVSAIALPVA